MNTPSTSPYAHASYRPICGFCAMSHLAKGMDEPRSPFGSLRAEDRGLHYSSMKRPPLRRRSDDSPYDLELAFCIVNAGRAMEQRLEIALEEIGLSLAKFGALTHLVEAGEPLSLSECAKRMTCVRSNITQLMDRLEVDGLVRRIDDPQDRRTIKAELTPTGIERQAAGARVVAKVQTSLVKELKTADAQVLTRALMNLR